MQEIAIANLVWGFDFKPSLDTNGEEVPPNLDGHQKVSSIND